MSLASSLPPAKVLPYTIYSHTPYSPNFPPENILHNRPSDQTSRWSAGIKNNVASASSNNATSDRDAAWGSLTGTGAGRSGKAPATNRTGTRQKDNWIVVKLPKRSILRGLAVGKYSQPHPCNVKHFRISASLDPPSPFSPEGSLQNLTTQERVLRQEDLSNPFTFGKFAGKREGENDEFSYGNSGGRVRTDKHNWTPVCNGKLRNDDKMERFDASWVDGEGDDEVILPCQYIKIEPLQGWTVNYNISIWYLELWGIDDETILDSVCERWRRFVTSSSIHLTLKELRQLSPTFLPAFDLLIKSLPTLQQRIPPLEHPLVSSLHSALVLRGDFLEAENILHEASSEEHGLFDQLAESTSPVALWERLNTPSVDGEVPGPRGGHAMVWVPTPTSSSGGRILLFGGYDGEKELGDFWEWNTETGRWALISRDLSEKGAGPGARSCHKLALDEGSGWVYLLGKYIPNGEGAGQSSDFWRYRAFGENAGTWEKLSSNTVDEGGPRLLRDHGMVVDSVTGCLYVYGGKYPLDKNAADSLDSGYSGMYKFDIARRKWTFLFGDPEPGEAYVPRRLLSRIGHTMLLDPKKRTITIMFGQRKEAYKNDVWSYALPLPTAHASAEEDQPLSRVSLITAHSPDLGGPEAGFTPKATCDNETGEWLLLTGLEVEAEPPHTEKARTELWLKKSSTNGLEDGSEVLEWQKVGRGVGKDAEPLPRFAHQLVLDAKNKVHYVMGGNPATEGSENVRLGDFWRLSLIRQTPQEILRKAKFLVRRQCFLEKCRSEPPLTCLMYLQTHLSAVVDHQNEGESGFFRACMADLLAASSAGGTGGSNSSLTLLQMKRSPSEKDMASDSPTPPISEHKFRERTHVFKALCEFFPDRAREPRGELSQLVQWGGASDNSCIVPSLPSRH